MLTQDKKAAMEMSVGTIVTIVLLVTVLVLGLVMVRSIFSSGTNAITQIDAQIQSQITKLFTEGEGSSKLVVYPVSREVTLKKGQQGGFGFSIQNLDSKTGSFTYTVSSSEIAKDCAMTNAQADALIDIGATDGGRPFVLGSGSQLENAVLVKFSIPSTASICKIRYVIDVKEDGKAYSTTTIDLVIK
ncbi:Uncharacterised protein [uncultured archaeon]|nr:Uncharacterised protein [uncultured archaeon]